MASTVAIDTADGRAVAGSRQTRKGTIQLGTYTTNGVAVTPAQLEVSVVYDIDVRPAGGYVFEWDKANAKIKAYRQKDPAAAGGADIALPEVANAVDLSLVLARFHATGA